jgi:phage-related protein
MPPPDPRTLAQNRLLWSMLADLSAQIEWPVWYDVRCTLGKMCAEDWKHVITAGLERQQRMAQGIEGGMVLLGQSTRSMTKARFRELLELLRFFGDSRGVRWSAPKEYEEWQAMQQSLHPQATVGGS